MKNVKLAFIGGDKRMFNCAEKLYDQGFECALYGFDKISDRANSTRCSSLRDCIINAAAVILPMPLSKDGVNIKCESRVIRISEVFEAVKPEMPVFAGALNEKISKMAEVCSVTVFDYLNDESLTLKNALATSEGAVFLAMKNSERTLYGSDCLVTGYGRIGSFTAKRLSALGANVTVLARRKEIITRAKLEGFKTITASELCDKCSGFEFVFNTVPSNLFGEKELSKMSSKQVYIELASAPFGMNKTLAQKYNIEMIDGSALPGKYCPESAGEYIAQVIAYELGRMGIS